MTELEFASFSGDAVSPLWPAVASIRWDVFVVEQEVPVVVEIDARDFLASTLHLLGLYRGKPVATCRVLSDRPLHFHLGRVAVRKDARGLGLGRQTIAAASHVIERMVPSGAKGHIVLDAQVQAQGFYESSGYYLTDREPFLDAGIWHREMAKSVVGTASD